MIHVCMEIAQGNTHTHTHNTWTIVVSIHILLSLECHESKSDQVSSDSGLPESYNPAILERELANFTMTTLISTIDIILSWNYKK